MAWVRLDDVFYDNTRNRELGPAGRDLFVAGLCYCAKGLTDGRIPKGDLPLILAQAQARKATVAKLLDAGRWVDHGEWIEVAEYLRYQRSRSQILAAREDAAERQRRARERASHGRSHSVTNGVSHGPPIPALPTKESPLVGSPPLAPAPKPQERVLSGTGRLAYFQPAAPIAEDERTQGLAIARSIPRVTRTPRGDDAA